MTQMTLKLRAPHLALGFFLLLGSTSFASGMSEVGLGGSYTAAMGTAYSSLGKAKPLGVDAMMAMDMGASSSIQLLVSGVFQKFDLANTPSPGASIYLLGAFGGLQFKPREHNGKSHSMLVPEFATQLGFTYDWLTFKDAVSPTQNSGLNLAARVSPGLSLEITSGMAIGLDFPLMIILLRSPLAIWSSTLSMKLMML